MSDTRRPHIGLQTVTWLTDGEVLHRDSLGSEQVIKPGQLNLMTSGGSVAHAEEATGHHRGTLEGIQLWVALPEATRHGGAAFEHHAELPQGELDEAVATVLMGSSVISSALLGAAGLARRRPLQRTGPGSTHPGRVPHQVAGLPRPGAGLRGSSTAAVLGRDLRGQLDHDHHNAFNRISIISRHQVPSSAVPAVGGAPRSAARTHEGSHEPDRP